MTAWHERAAAEDDDEGYRFECDVNGCVYRSDNPAMDVQCPTGDGGMLLRVLEPGERR